MSKQKLEAVVEQADLAFWEVVAKSYPEAKTGDFPADALVELENAMEQAVTKWLRLNTDQGKDSDYGRDERSQA